jgi:hypothetical protein
MSSTVAVSAEFDVRPEEYRIAVAGAHRKPPPRVGVPALIWHYGLWRPAGDDTRWQHAIDSFLYRLYLILKSDPGFTEQVITPNYDYHNDTLYLFTHFAERISEDRPQSIANLQRIDPASRLLRYDVFSIQTIFRSFNLLVRAELFSEFWNIDFICDFDKVDSACIEHKTSPLYPYANDLKDIYDFTCQQFQAHTNREFVDRITADTDDRLKEIRRTLHKRFRDVVKDEILEKCLSDTDRTLLGTKFAEFHGAVFGFETNGRGSASGTKSRQDGPIQSEPPDPIDLKPIQVGHSPSVKKKTIQSQIGGFAFGNDVAVRLVDAMWPLIKEIQRSKDEEEEEEDRYGKPEFTVSFLQHKRSIYISSLGWLDPQLDSEEARPIVYTLIVSYRSRWALGRLVERIHSMASFRLAAIREIEKVNLVGDELKRIEEDLRTAEEQLLKGTIKEIDGNRFAFRILTAGSGIKYGLMHRVERSDYYVREFERNIANLRCKRIEGFQPYDQFVKRRMYGAFDYIKRIGDRYRELRQEIDLILRNDNSTKVRQVANRLETDARETNALLHAAEIIIAFPLVYYLGHILADIVVAVGKVLGKTVEEHVPLGVSYLMMAVVVVVLLRVLRPLRKKWAAKSEEAR